MSTLLFFFFLAPSCKQIQKAHWQKVNTPHRRVAVSQTRNLSLSLFPPTLSHTHIHAHTLVLQLRVANDHIEKCQYMSLYILCGTCFKYYNNNNNIKLHFLNNCAIHNMMCVDEEMRHTCMHSRTHTLMHTQKR